MGLFRRCKEQWALVKEMRTMFKAEWERAKRWHAITQAEAETLSDEELWDCITSRLPQVEEPEELAELPGVVRVVYTLYWYDLEVQNGGLCQYFVNSSRITAPYLPEALTAVGAEGGTMTVIKDLNMKEPYVGTVDLLGGEIAEDIASYFVESEQIPTACGLGVLIERDQSVRAAGGYLIQLMPGADEDTITRVEGGVLAAGNVSAILDKDPDPEHLLKTVLSDYDVKILESDPVEYKCYCSRERVERALISLGAEELKNILREQGSCQMTCQFCDAVYRFDGPELQKLIDTID